MSEVTFKYPCGIKAKCKITGFKGTIIGRHQIINGCLQYIVQPPIKSDEGNYIPDAYAMDEENIQVLETLSYVEDDQKEVGAQVTVTKVAEYQPEKVTFAYETGDLVKSRINGYTGTVTIRKQDMNGCERYRVEGQLNKDGKETSITVFKQEIERMSAGLNAPDEKPIQRAKTGGPSTRETCFNKEERS